MMSNDNSYNHRGFWTPQASWKSSHQSEYPSRPLSEGNKKEDNFRFIHKVPTGDSPYVRAKHVQLIEKDPCRAISLFWAAINSGDRVDSALKDMAAVMKQLNRADEAIEAVKSFRHLCPYDQQESIDNVLVELYKRSGRVEEEIELLESKLKKLEVSIGSGGRRTKNDRSQGKKILITLEQERSKILGNLAWAYLQLEKYEVSERYYRKALFLEPDRNKQCNLAICLMKMNRIMEAKSLLQNVKASCGNRVMDESYAKSYERAFLMLGELMAGKDNYQSDTRRATFTPYNKNSRSEASVNEGQDYFLHTQPKLQRNSNENRDKTAENWRKPTTFTDLDKNLESRKFAGKENYQSDTRRAIFNPFNKNSRSEASVNEGQDYFLHTQPKLRRNSNENRDKTAENWRKPMTFTDLDKNLESRKFAAEDYMVKSDPPSIGIPKKSWADMVEEDEEEFKKEILCSRRPVKRSLLRKFTSTHLHETCN